MSRGLLRATGDICADCSAPDPCWASVNRGVLVCDECCTVHRSLGRHISQIKSLKKGSWSSTQLAMVHQLVSMGANNIWEHSLLDPGQNKQGRRTKPNPRDPVHPTKADYIRAKYQFLAFVNKQRDSEVTSVDDLSKQLHSSVRTNNLETSLRLLSSGADPNYFSQERGNTALHIAAQCGQALQAELLLVYGADPGAVDVNSKTPVDHARTEKHGDLADRLVESQFELTDRLAFFLCSRKPDHRNAQHFIIPEMADSSLDLSELAKAAKKKLQALSNHLFEELAMDVYDEVDRRENENIWLSTHNQSNLVTDRQTVPFLPVNPEFSSTRNQGRQKLARFNAREFATLVIDILSDARRRQLGVNTTSTLLNKGGGERSTLGSRDLLNRTQSVISDDEPLYDSVASDEDYASIADSHSMKDELEVKTDNQSALSSEAGEGATISVEQYLGIKQLYTASQQQVLQLAQLNQDLKQEVLMLHNMVERLIQENQSLHGGGGESAVSRLTNGHEPGVSAAAPRHNRPQSMFEPRDQTKYQHWQKIPSPTSSKDDSSLIKSQGYGSKGSSSSSLRSQTITEHTDVNCVTSDYDNANNNSAGTEGGEGGGERGTADKRASGSGSDKSSRSSGRSECSQVMVSESARSFPDSASGEDLSLPTQEDVVKKTEKITKRIQEMLFLAQEDKQDSYLECAEKICNAVVEMTALFPSNLQEDRVQAALRLLRGGADRLTDQCQVEPPSTTPRHHTQQVIQCAYDIAKAAKQIVIMFE